MFDGNGNWTSDFSAISDRDNNIKILASRFDGIFIADIKESFENCLTKDGQIAPIGAFNMGGQKVTNLATGTNDNDAVNVSQIETRLENLLSALYPVGSMYIGTQAECPLGTLIAGSTWTVVASKVVVNVASTVAVKGTGKTLGLTNGTTKVGLNSTGSDVNARIFNQASYNKNVSTSSYGNEAVYGAFGVDTDSTKSGLTGTATSSTLTLNIWKRTA